MKKVELKDVKPGFYWLKDAGDGSFDPVAVHEGYGGKLYYMFIGNEVESAVTQDDAFYEMIAPTGHVLFAKEYDGESIVDLSRDISECLDSDFNPKVKAIPEMEDFPGFWAGQFVVTVAWVPDDEEV